MSKLPYKMREMWRVYTFNIQEISGKRATFSNLVSFINRQAKIAADPVFGEMKDAEDKGKSFLNVRMNKSVRPKGSTFTTSVAPAANEKSPEHGKNASAAAPSRSSACTAKGSIHWQSVVT